jgi:hypothetical protein
MTKCDAFFISLMFTHIVLFKLHDRAPANIQKFRDTLLSMDGKIPQIKGMEVGVNVVESARAYDVALVQRFDSLDTMQEYQNHPVHQAILPYLRESSSSTVAVDYVS